jgi:hypothetical protein
MLKSVLDLIRSATETREWAKEYQELCKFASSGLRAEITSLTMELKWTEYSSENRERTAVISVLRKKNKAPVCAFGNMLKSFMYIKNYKRIILILAFFLLYISMYLIHNVYGPVCIIKSSGDKSSSSKGDIDVSKLYKANSSNLFVSNVHNMFSSL